MDVSKHRLTLMLACLTLAGCSAARQTPLADESPVSATADPILSTSTIQSAFDVRVTWPPPSGYGYPLRQSYPSFAHYYPYRAVDYRRYSAWGANFVHPRYGWQPQPGIGYINDQGIGRSNWSEGSD